MIAPVEDTMTDAALKDATPAGGAGGTGGGGQRAAAKAGEAGALRRGGGEGAALYCQAGGVPRSLSQIDPWNVSACCCRGRREGTVLDYVEEDVGNLMCMACHFFRHLSQRECVGRVIAHVQMR